MLNTSSNKSETCIFILQKGRGKVNFRQQQRSLIKLYARTSFNTQALKKEICKNIFGYFKHTVSNWALTRFVPFFNRRKQNFSDSVLQIISGKICLQIKKWQGTKKLKLENRISNAKKVNIILLLQFFQFFLIFLKYFQMDNIWVAVALQMKSNHRL